MSKLIKNGTVVTASDKYSADVLIDDEKIIAIGSGLDERAVEIIDAGGKYLWRAGQHDRLGFPIVLEFPSDIGQLEDQILVECVQAALAIELHDADRAKRFNFHILISHAVSSFLAVTRLVPT